MKTILFIVTAATSLNGDPTGFWFEELATPYYEFIDAGYEVTLASIPGGPLPIDAKSIADGKVATVVRFEADTAAMHQLKNSQPLANLDFEQFDGIFFPGGHGAVIDLPNDPVLADKLGHAYDAGITIGAVCHGPGGLVSAKRADGKSILHGKRVNSFTNAEEEAVGLTDAVPFLLETRMVELGATFEGGANFENYAVRDGNIITGQNPASSERVAELMMESIEEK